MSFHETLFYVSCENKKSWIPALKGILLICTHIFAHMNLWFQINRASVPQANLDSWLLVIKKKKLEVVYFISRVPKIGAEV